MKKILFLVVLLMRLNMALAQLYDNSKNDSIGEIKQIYPRQLNKSRSIMDSYDVKFYFLDVNIEHTSTQISGNVRIDAKVVSPALDTFALDMSDTLRVDSIYINNNKCLYSKVNNKLLVFINPALNINDNFTAKIYYYGIPKSNGMFSGMSNSTNNLTYPNEDTVTWTLSEPFNAYQWWPCKQDLSDKADSAWIFITTDASNKAGSNGILTRITDLPNNKKKYEWKTKHKIAYYLISASVAKYLDYSIYAHMPNSSDSVLIQNYIYNNQVTFNQYKADIDQTRDFLILFSQLFGPYPYKDEKYGHCMAPIWGGMEHQTMTTITRFGFYLTSHELSHQWFGDMVTCADWQNIWINEGWAAYSEFIAAQYLINLEEANSYMETLHSSVMSSTGGSVYVPFDQANDINRIFNSRLTYNKGASVIHMLRFELHSDTTFFQIIKQYLNTYKDTVATIDNFKGIVESYTGKNYTDFFNQWIYGEGYPIYHISWNQTGNKVTIHSSQTTSSEITPLFKMDYECKLHSLQGDTIVVIHQTNNVNEFTFNTSHKIISLIIDPNNWNLMKFSSYQGNGEEDINKLFLIYPNPATDVINVNNLTFLNSTINICDVTGKVIIQEKLNNGNNSIDISKLSTGVYLLKIYTENGSVVTRIIKS